MDRGENVNCIATRIIYMHVYKSICTCICTSLYMVALYVCMARCIIIIIIIGKCLDVTYLYTTVHRHGMSNVCLPPVFKHFPDQVQFVYCVPQSFLYDNGWMFMKYMY